MKKNYITPLILSLFAFTLCGCSDAISTPETITITFEQYDCNHYSNYDLFGNKKLATSELVYDYDYKLTNSDISSFETKVKYVVPQLAYGYFTFTHFYFNKDNAISDNQIKEMILKKDIILYFGIYG